MPNAAHGRLTIQERSMATLQLPELALSYEIAGQGTPLLFLHQVATDQRLWRRQRTYFRARYRPITVDVLGHGRVTWPPQERSLAQAARRVQQLLEHLGTEPAFVIGVSMSAAIAMRLALNAPALVRGLALVSPWSHPNDHMRALISRLVPLAEAGDMRRHTTLLLRYSFPVGYLEAHSSDERRLWALALAQPAEVVAYAWVACLTCDLRRAVRAIRAPSLVIAGRSDLFTPPYLARAVARELADVEIEVWEEAGHFPFWSTRGALTYEWRSSSGSVSRRAGRHDGPGERLPNLAAELVRGWKGTTMPKATGARRMAQGTAITQVQAALAFYSCMARMQLSLSQGEHFRLGDSTRLP
jgi:3-oxoadipate enol-lactonase